ncbi:cytochrome c biogenesis protein [Pyrobaculum neutrophilum]|uniref:Cytochrome c biogenesis protein transmembrane region n=1 Tax=Pyrobaculum neutrophilum (strain DSM 2338 / JCM 9278 / NBRC 100436 / V24Sta) TaxID=444157 RepID=B1YCR0_PYRNV|nr:cytochrome c biogenesis protein [Pyrobaculum neutrophilum]ACB39573.1 cytochrome c biogenesis protein transmembrane region [Pyrobaculum neutrophilum V24Sta]
MRALTALLIASALVLALQIGQLQFIDVNSAQDLANALGEGPVLIFIHQPDCPGCIYMKTQVFPNGQVAAALKGVRLISIDLSKYLLRSLDVVADGQVYIYYERSLSVQRASGPQRIPVVGTPTLVMGYVKDGKLHVTFVMIGAADVPTFLEFVKMAYGAAQKTPQQAPQQAPQPTPNVAVQLAASFAAGAASVFSPCVLPVLTIAATTYLARRSLPLVLAGMAASFAALATAVTALASWVGQAVNTALYLVGGAVLIAMGLVLVVERLNRSFVLWASRFQTSAYKASKRAVGRAGDVLLGASLGAVWTPCIAPFFGAVVVANFVASALSGNYIALFVSTLAYAAGLAVVIHLLVGALKRGAGRASRSMKWAAWGRRLEYAVGIASIALGALLIGEAAGLGTFSALFKL